MIRLEQLAALLVTLLGIPPGIWIYNFIQDRRFRKQYRHGRNHYWRSNRDMYDDIRRRVGGEEDKKWML